MATPSANAGEVTDLYDAEVAVRGQGVSEREEALRRALGEVLIKVSGDRNASGLPALSPILEKAPQYVQQYRYQAPRQGQPSAAEQLLWVRFNGEAVERALREARVPVWGRVRPLTLVWLAVDENSQRYLVSEDAASEIALSLEAAAKRRGLPLLLPLMDLEDQGRLQPADVWGGFRDVILQASTRYQTEAVLAGRIFEERPGAWVARWTLYQKGSIAEWQFEGAEAEVAAAGVDQAADALAARFAVQSGDRDRARLMLTVSDVHSAEGYARVARYLKGLNPVVQLQVIQVDVSSVRFLLDVRGDRRALEQAIALGNTLAPAPEAMVSAPAPVGSASYGIQDNGPVLAYRFLP